MTKKYAKSCFSVKKLILTSEWCAEHPFAGGNTQHMAVPGPPKSTGQTTQAKQIGERAANKIGVQSWPTHPSLSSGSYPGRFDLELKYPNEINI